ncbi:tRNA pseudouridine(55) synthase TruB [Metabacillus sp. GX 13764]|uniref:tRNA pseudouridine(55) synthase TruB n=1 Tax=Metabacillus kandeliae TaxID=2900151 RepID=UPI001E3CA42B|nr:tRNA pseudouridine(55) synthase TruB [Metabacillus kandeliae]MCD7033737.1 tRNA pseudouridine(55) synthase TruB [Metabacillus kandeliae]
MDGVLLLNKPAGMTSHDCVSKTRRLLKTKKVGHTGTLDPDVTGVLPLCIGRATKIAEYLTAAVKTYEAEVTVGISTETEDASGEIVERESVKEGEITEQLVREALLSLTGEMEQVPPMYSAVKINGKKLYEYAREGKQIERPARIITVHELVQTSPAVYHPAEKTVSFGIRAVCSKGTYIRTLAVMIGEKLGFPAHMSKLARTGSGQFELSQCLSFEEIQEKIAEGTLNLISIGEALNHLPKWVINDTLAEKVKNGAVLEVPEQLKDLPFDAPAAVFGEHGECLAIYSRHPEKTGVIKPVKVLYLHSGSM